MPINPNIALQVQPPAAPPNPLESLAKVLQLKNAIAQQPLIQAQVERAGLENQQLGQQVGATKAMNQAFKDAVTVGPDGAPSLDKDAITKGLASSGYGSQIPAVIEHFNTMEKTAGEVRKQKADLAATEQNYAGAGAAGVKAAGYDPGAAITFLTHAVALFGPNSPSAAALAAIQEDPTKVQPIMDHLLAASPKQQELATSDKNAQARVLGAQTGQQRFNAELPGIQALNTQRQQSITGTTPVSPAEQLRIDIERANADRAARGQAATEQHNKVMEKQGAQRVGLEAQGVEIRKVEADPFGQFGINKNPIGGGVPGAGGALQTGEDYLRTLPPGMAARVKAIAEGRENPPPRANSGVPLQIMNAVNQYDPNFSLQRAQIRKAFTTGSDGKNIGALNTAAVHLDQLADAADAMHNGTFRPGNAMYNTLSTMLGGAAPTNFEGVKAAVSGEMATALKGNATDEEIKTIKATIDRSSSPEQFKGAVQEGLKVLGAKLNTYQERYSQQIPGDTNWSPVMPTAKAVFDKHGVNPTAVAKAVQSSAGATFKAGDSRMVNGVKYVRDDKGTWNPQ